ncbi:AbrB/MazE/SpoVT family DNA-binding domain-containing protein [Sphingobium aromaticivastans]|uniref:antitoxin n=1 Tax=Sphingobium aromaticivastans TaxID=1778665 RepID=UPI00301A09E4
MNGQRHVKLFKNGRSQAICIPRAFALPGEKAIIRNDGDRLIIAPVPVLSLAAYLATLEPIDDDFGPIEDAPPDPVGI